MPDIGRAADRILQALAAGEHVGISPDSDSDGTTAGAVIWRALTWFGFAPDKLHFFVSHRMREGYGLNHDVAKRILTHSSPISLVITADSGTADNDRIADLLANGVETVVTDHHGMDIHGVPAAAYACVSPLRPDSQYTDKYICGVMVAWLLMCEVRRRGISAGLINGQCPSMTTLLGLCAIGTVADCVSLSSKNNRAVVRAGLQHLQRSPLPFCVALREEFCRDGKVIDEELIGFQVAPRLAAFGRLDESAPGIRFLLTDSIEEARELLVKMTEANESRKKIQQAMSASSMEKARGLISEGNVGLAIYLEDGMPGVHGINSARITEFFGLPSAMISPMMGRPEMASISCRGGDLCNIKQVLDRIKESEPGLLLSGGGHVAAGGGKILTEEVKRFQWAFDRAVREQIGEVSPARRIRHDGELPADSLSFQTIGEIAAVGPFGKGFDSPLWLGHFQIGEAKRIGKDGTHLSLQLRADQADLRAVWFRAMENERAPMTFRGGESALVAFRLVQSEWKGRKRLEAMIEHARLSLKPGKAGGW
ncbi:MAG: hypothetical protein E6Q76_05595 [Rhizobium sp.]|nr:MAG: hypothetical protein E6Q76_05595 [Rhizobium sp.]